MDAILQEISQMQRQAQTLKYTDTKAPQQLEVVFKHANHPKRKPLADKIQQMVAYVKRLEFLIRAQMQTPLQLFSLLQSSAKFKSLLNEDIKSEDLKRIEKMAGFFASLKQEFPYALTEQFI